jgi:hypothetical protein
MRHGNVESFPQAIESPMTLQATKLRESVEWATHDDPATADPKLGNLTLPLFSSSSLCLRVSVRAKSETRTARRNGAGERGGRKTEHYPRPPSEFGL